MQSGATSELRCQQLNHLNNFKEKYQVSSELCCQLSNCDDNQAEKDKSSSQRMEPFFMSKLTPSEWQPVTVALTSSFVYVDFSAFFFFIFIFYCCCSVYTNRSCLRPHFWDLAQRPHPGLTSAASSSRQSGHTRKGGKNKGGAIALFENVKWCKPKQIVKEQQCTRDTELLAMGTILSARGVFTQYCNNDVHPSLGQCRCNLQASPQCCGTAWDRPSSSLSPQNREPCFPVYHSPQLPLIRELLHQGQ